MSHTVLAGQVRIGGRPWGDGETLLVPVGQDGLKMELSGGDYAVVVTVYHQLARAPKGTQPTTGRALVQVMGAGMKPVTLETVTVEVLEGGRRGLRIAPPDQCNPGDRRRRPWKWSSSSRTVGEPTTSACDPQNPQRRMRSAEAWRGGRSRGSYLLGASSRQRPRN